MRRRAVFRECRDEESTLIRSVEQAGEMRLKNAAVEKFEDLREVAVDIRF
jgi:hypothetical protein